MPPLRVMQSLPLPPPVVERIHGFLVVRDDLIPGGTKQRVIPRLFSPDFQEYVYPSPVQGYAQIALALAARDCGKRATIFCAKRNQRHPRTLRALAAGAALQEVRPGYLSQVKKVAADYCVSYGAKLLPWGLACPEMVAGIAEVAAGLALAPEEVWSVAGSGTLQRGLQLAWSKARFFAVQVGAMPNVGRATLLVAPERYEQPARQSPPYPSCDNYDAKLWRFVKAHASPGAVIWNVAG